MRRKLDISPLWCRHDVPLDSISLIELPYTKNNDIWVHHIICRHQFEVSMNEYLHFVVKITHKLIMQSSSCKIKSYSSLHKSPIPINSQKFFLEKAFLKPLIIFCFMHGIGASESVHLEWPLLLYLISLS